MPASSARWASARWVDGGEQIWTASTRLTPRASDRSAATASTRNFCASAFARRLSGSTIATMSAPRRCAARPCQYPISPAPTIATRNGSDFLRKIRGFMLILLRLYQEPRAEPAQPRILQPLEPARSRKRRGRQQLVQRREKNREMIIRERRYRSDLHLDDAPSIPGRPQPRR